MSAPALEASDELLVRALVSELSRVALELAIARGRLRRGHVTARSYLVDARGHVLRLKLELEQQFELRLKLELEQQFEPEGLDVVIVRRWEWALRLAAEDVELARSMPEGLDVVIVRRWEWALRLAAEDVELARSMLGRSMRLRVVHAMLADVQGLMVRAGARLLELSRRAWSSRST